MMKKIILLSALLCGTALFAADNLISNGDFSQGKTGWHLGMSKTIKTAGGRQEVEDNCLITVIPDMEKLDSTGILVIRKVSLESGKTYRLSYTLEVEKAGTMRHVYQQSGTPYKAMGLSENVPVEAGTTEIAVTFECTRPKDVPSHLTLNLSKLRGKVLIDNVKIQEVVELPVSALNKNWSVFTNVKPPDSFASVPAILKGTKADQVSPEQAALKKGKIDLLKFGGKKHDNRARALLYNEFTSPGPGFIRIGFSACWWMKIYINGKEIYSTLDTGNRSGKFIPNDHEVELAVQEGKNVLAVVVQSGESGWKFVCGTPDPPITYTANDEWKAVDMDNVVVKEGSALDLSSLVDKPAGKHGRATIGPDGSLVFEKAPKKPIRMLGFNGLPYKEWSEPDEEVFRANMRKFAQAARRQGYSLFRFHGSFDRTLCEGATQDMSIQPDKLDRWDYLVSELKREGIYCHMVIFSFGLYERSSARKTTFDERDKHKLQFYLGGEWERKRFRYGAETVLNHVNPYTGVAWKDEPTIAFLEFYNEHELGLDRMGKTLKDYPETKAFLESEWRKWLCARHGNKVPASLASQLKGAALDAAPLPMLYDRKTELGNEFALFRMHISKECAKWCEGVVRGTGYNGLITQYNASKKLGESAVRWQVSEVVDMHSYYRHPSGGWGAAGCRVKQDSSLEDAAGYWRYANSTRVSGRPFIVSEFNHCFWNPYQHEGGIVFSAYSALQGFSALEIHSGPVSLVEGTPKVGCFTCGKSPVVRASEFLSACLYRRGDVAEAGKTVELVVPEEALKTGCTSLGAVSTEQSRLGLMTGFSLAFPWAERPERTTDGGKAEMRILPTGVATVDAHDWFVDVIENKDGDFSLADTVKVMKEKQILSADNISDPEKGIFQSDTGEITLRSKEHLLKVNTPRTEAVTLEAGKKEKVGSLTVVNSSVSACIAVCSATSKPIAKSNRMVLIYSTEMVNTDMVLGYDRELMKDTGKGPALMRCGKLNVALSCIKPESFKLFALDFNGERREELPVSIADGQLVIKLDTAKLADGPTSFFELVSEPEHGKLWNFFHGLK